MLRFAAIVFALAALAGPLVRLVTWPPSRFEKATSTGTEDFVYDLVLYLWPTQPLAAVEATAGRLMAALLSIGGNLLLFILLGLAVGAAAGRRGIVPLIYTAVCGLLVLFAFWGAGFSLEHLSWRPLAVAMVLYAVPFWLVTRAAVRPGIPN